jgi:methyltransferase (TIGR00027 family)
MEEDLPTTWRGDCAHRSIPMQPSRWVSNFPRAGGSSTVSQMEAGEPSRTALGAAVHRAAHQRLERGSIFADPLAVRILGVEGEEFITRASADPSSSKLRLFIAVRTRFAEDALAAALSRGVGQIVVLGAGLDTFAYRGTVQEHVRIFEVDHPATQKWKRKRLAEVAIPAPPALTFAPVDFEREALGSGLERAGFDPGQCTFFSWLGVVPYLTKPAVLATLRYIANLSAGGEVAFDYANPRSESAQASPDVDHDALAERVASVGEPFKSYFETEALLATLRGLGMSNIEDLGPAQIRARFFPNYRGKPGNNIGGHIVRAASDRL